MARPPRLFAISGSVLGATGGDSVVLTGLGFGAKPGLIVHWGNQQLSGSSLVSVSPRKVRLYAPPHSAGEILVSVETAFGESESHSVSYVDDGPVPIAFNFTTTASNLWPEQPTCADWGPDGRLYVGTLAGTVHAIGFDEDYAQTSHDTYDGVSMLANHEILGLTFDPFDTSGVVKIHVAHSELFAQGGGAFVGPSPYPGQVSVLSGPDFDAPAPLITGLPSSNHDHGVNGMVFDNNGDLLLCVGGTTDAGIKHVNIGDLPESPLAGAILKAKTSRPDFNGLVHYLERAAPYGADDDQVHGEDVTVAPGSHVTVHAPGLRNPFDLVLHTNGLLYATDNGPNPGFGGSSTGPASDGGDVLSPDELLLIEAEEYYGHPNRARGPEDARQYVYQHTTAPAIPHDYAPPLLELESSTNGIDEYRATCFRSAMRGELLVQRWIGELARISLSADGRLSSSFDDDFTPTTTWSLNIRNGPGGAVLGMHLQGTDVNVLRPVDPAAVGVTAYDIFPWRALRTGGAAFVIGGKNFAGLAQTSVTIGGLPAVLTEVSGKRIHGVVPAMPGAGTGFHDVVVRSGRETSTLSAAFRYLFPGPGMEPGRWMDMPQPPATVADTSMLEQDGILYLLGAGDSNTYVYDIAAQTWAAPASPAQRSFAGGDHAGVAFDGLLYFFGGLSGGAAGKLQIYDPLGDQWSLGSDMPWHGGACSAARIGSLIYVVGGHLDGGATSDACYAYEPASNTWSAALAPMPAARNHAAAGTDGQSLWVFGGCGPGSGDLPGVANGFADVQVYDPLGDSWSSSSDMGAVLQPMPIGRSGAGKAIWYAGEFYIFGGQTDTGPGASPSGVYQRVDVYDPLTHTWRQEASMPTARHGAVPARYGSRIFLVGGGEASGFVAGDAAEVFTRQ